MPAPTSRRRRVIAVVVAALTLVFVGAGAYWAGRQTAPGPAVVVVAGPVVEQAPGTDPLPLTVLGGTAAWPVVLTPAPTLPDTPGTASGYHPVRAGLDGAELTAAIAGALGVPGEVRAYNEGWVVSGDTATSATVEVFDDALLAWAMDDPAAASAFGGRQPTPARSRELAEAILGGLGVQATEVDWQVDRYDDRVLVTAWQLVAGLRTGLSWTIGLGAQGAVVSASGFAASLEEIPGYHTVGAATAVRRAALPTWAVIGPTPIPEATAEFDLNAASPSEPRTSPPLPTVAPGSRPALAVGLSEVAVTAATDSLAQFRQPDGSLLILPAYELTGRDGSRWSLIAVSAEDVRFVDQPYPGTTPATG